MNIVIAGAGYAGVTAANKLARKGVDDVHVTIVSPGDEFVERIRLHQTVAGTGAATRPLAAMLDDRITHCPAAVLKVGDGSVDLSDGTSLGFDRLIVAVGNSDEAPDGTLAVGAVDDAREASRAVAALGEGGTVTVIGGGLTGIEAASEIASARPDLSVTLVGDEIAGSMSDGARARILDVLGALGVTVVRGRWDGTLADVTLWAVAAQVHPFAAASGLAVDDAGRIAVDHALRSTSHPSVYAVGDIAAVLGSRPSCQAAIPQGGHAAASILREVRARAPKPFSMSFAGQNVSLGRRDAVIQHSHRDDDPTRVWFGRRPAVFVKEQICRTVVRTARSGVALALPGPK